MVRLKGPSRPGPQGGRSSGVDPGEVLRLLEDALLGDRDDGEAVDQLVVEREVEVALDLGHHAVAGPARVVGGGLEEVEEGHGVGGVRGAGRHDDRRGVGGGAVARGVADGAGLGDAREAHGLLGEADRELAAFLPGDAEGAVAAGAGQEVAEDPRQHVEDRVGDAEVLLGAERAVLEALLGSGRRRARRGARARRRRRPPAGGRGRPCTRRRRRRRAPRITSTAAMRSDLVASGRAWLPVDLAMAGLLRRS